MQIYISIIILKTIIGFFCCCWVVGVGGGGGGWVGGGKRIYFLYQTFIFLIHSYSGNLLYVFL